MLLTKLLEFPVVSPASAVFAGLSPVASGLGLLPSDNPALLLFTLAALANPGLALLKPVEFAVVSDEP